MRSWATFIMPFPFQSHLPRGQYSPTTFFQFPCLNNSNVCVLQGLGEQGGPVVQRPHAAGQDLPARARPPQTDPSTAPRPPPPHARRRGGLTARSVTGLLQARRRHSDGQVTAIVSSVQDFTAAWHQLQVTLPLTGVDLDPILPKLLSL